MTDFAWPERSLKISAFLAIYLIWGSTYLAIRLLSETLPGLTMMGLRFFLAGIILYLWARWRGVARPTWRHWRAGAIAGGLMLCGGTGGVVVAIRHLDSGLVALLVGMVPLWIALLMWVWPGRDRPGRGQAPPLATVGALVVGFVGVAILAAPGDVLGGAAIHLPSVFVTLLACVSWGVGSLYSRGAELPSSPRLVSSLQMLTGGALIVVWGLIDGEWGRFDPQTASWTSVLAFFYLVVFGSLVAFSAYSWLIRNAEPTLVATYAYVNPVVAIVLGWWIAGEWIAGRTVLAATLIVGSVILVTTLNARRRRRGPTPRGAAGPRADAPATTGVGASPRPASVPVYDAGTQRPLGKCA